MFISRRNNGIYYIYFEQNNGKRTCISTKSKNKSDALRFLSRFEQEIKKKAESKITPIRLKQFIFEFLKHSEGIHTPKTTKCFNNTFGFLLKYFGDVQLTEISHKKINEYITNRLNISSKYQARKDLILIKSFLEFAVSNNYLLENPARNIKQIKIPEKLPLYFTESDFEKLLNAIDNKDFKDLVKFAAFTGLRQMEIITLKWNQINLKDKFITLNNQTHVTKSKKIRTIPINNSVLEILTERKENSINDLVFSNGFTPYTQNYIVHKFKRYVQKADIKKEFHFHSLRHTFASWLVQKGISILHVKELLGHADVKTSAIYSHISPESLLDAVQKIDRPKDGNILYLQKAI
jgi:integrase